MWQMKSHEEKFWKRKKDKERKAIIAPNIIIRKKKNPTTQSSRALTSLCKAFPMSYSALRDILSEVTHLGSFSCAYTGEWVPTGYLTYLVYS